MKLMVSFEGLEDFEKGKLCLGIALKIYLKILISEPLWLIVLLEWPVATDERLHKAILIVRYEGIDHIEYV